MEQDELKDQVEPTHVAWAIVEIFGHTTLAGEISKTEKFGAVMLRIDVPASGDLPGFTREYNPSALYGITYCSEEVARLTARQLAAKPINVYVPELDDYGRLLAENKKLKGIVNELTTGLPAPTAPSAPGPLRKHWQAETFLIALEERIDALEQEAES